MNDKPQIIVCACGKSARFGSDKLTHPLDNTQSILAAVLRNIQSGTQAQCSVVVPQNKNDLINLVKQENASHLVMPSSQGLGHTIAFAVKHFPTSPGWLVCLGDMPFIPASLYAKIYHAANQENIIAPCFLGQRGHPVYFPQKYFKDLMSLSGDKGGAAILRNNQANLKLIDVKNVSVLRDIDTRQDLAQILPQYTRK